MVKRHPKSAKALRRRSARVDLGDLNPGKAQTVRHFLHVWPDVTQYAVDLFWQRQDMTATLADLSTVHRIRDRFGLTTRLAQALAKQAKELIRSSKDNGVTRKPRLRKHAATLFDPFVKPGPLAGTSMTRRC